MTKYLLDANLSPLTRQFLERQFDLDVIDLASEGLSSLPDEDVVALAKRSDRVIITFDLDFGEMYYLREPGTFGVIILRLVNQTVEAVNGVLGNFFSQLADQIYIDFSLIVIDEDRVRIARNR